MTLKLEYLKVLSGHCVTVNVQTRIEYSSKNFCTYIQSLSDLLKIIFLIDCKKERCISIAFVSHDIVFIYTTYEYFSYFVLKCPK